MASEFAYAEGCAETISGNVLTLIDSFSGAICNPLEQVAHFVSLLVVATCCDFQTFDILLPGFKPAGTQTYFLSLVPPKTTAEPVTGHICDFLLWSTLKIATK